MQANEAFWHWFTGHEKEFYRAVEAGEEIDATFIDHLFPRLQELNSQFYCLAGMYDDQTAELIITAEGDVKTFIFIEDLVAAAPPLANWRFTALSPALGFQNSSIKMDGYNFNRTKICFVDNWDSEYPDEINLTFIHDDFTESDKKIIHSGIQLFLDNALGELNAAQAIDFFNVAGPLSNQKTIPVDKLGEFITWKQKEFIEKYEGVRYDAKNDSYATLEVNEGDGFPMIALVNQGLLSWNEKAGHPWMLVVKVKFDGNERNGFPNNAVADTLNNFEDYLFEKLDDSCLNLGRSTHRSTRTIYIACREFRNASRITGEALLTFQPVVEASYDLFKDKYWLSVKKFDV